MSHAEYTHKTKRDPEMGLVKVHGIDKDLVWHVLYDDDLELMRDILMQASIRAQRDASCETDIVLYTSGCQNVACMRVIFFCVLAVDSELKKAITDEGFCSQVWTAHGRAAPLDPRKAEQFYSNLLPSCIHVWMRKEQDTCTKLVDSIRMLYLCS